MQNFRTSVARTLHLRDLPETDLLQRLQALCSAHQEFTLLSKRYETASPVGDHPCPRYDDPIPPSTHCRAPRYAVTPPLTDLDATPSHSHGHNKNYDHGQNHHTRSHSRHNSHSHNHSHSKHEVHNIASHEHNHSHHTPSRNHSHVHPHRYH